VDGDASPHAERRVRQGTAPPGGEGGVPAAAHYLGVVEAPDEKSPEAAAVTR
jgi:hypothetical protein